MDSARSRRMTRVIAVGVHVTVLPLAFAAMASGQTISGGLFSHVETLTRSDGTPVSGPAALRDDTAVVGGENVVYVFERGPDGDRWTHTATLAASDAAPGFGQSVATDGSTTVVGADGAAYVFARRLGAQSWQEIRKLTGDLNPGSFGGSVAVSGTTAVVGAPVPDVIAGERGPGVAYVFERDQAGPEAWGEVARLMGPPFSGRLVDAFGSSVAVDQDRVVVGAFSPRTIPDGFSSSSSAFVFSRDRGGANVWGMIATLPLGPSVDTGPAEVSISGDTAIAGAAQLGSRIFERDRGGPDAWAGQPLPVFNPAAVTISGDLAALSSRSNIFPTRIFGRHQGGEDRWGEVGGILRYPQTVAISGDTLLVGYDNVSSTQPRLPIDVYVADTDRDGRRDGADPCPRDPLNNVAGGCARNSAVSPVLDDLVGLEDVVTQTRGNEFHITATFTNSSASAIGNPFFEVTELTGGNELVNADGGAGGVGATLSPDVGDGVFSPGESLTTTFVIRLATYDAFSFRVSVRGETGPSSGSVVAGGLTRDRQGAHAKRLSVND